ncbi:MAG: hypothetical protein J7578_09365 [Chitinophagaceae bacterium]|nr:hypothetical protein [Chitinophagaceae bacterium]
MKLNLMILAFSSCLAILSCKEKPAQAPAETPTAPATPDKPITYLPVGDLIREDIRRVDSFAAGILVKKEGAKKDSSYIDIKAFKKLAEQFLTPELDSANFAKNFGQESFMDQTTELINFIYPAKNETSTVRKVVVYIKPSLTIDKVNRIYIEKALREGNDYVQQKLTWVIEKYFYILTIRHPEKGDPVTSVEKVIWDPQSYAD